MIKMNRIVLEVIILITALVVTMVPIILAFNPTGYLLYIIFLIAYCFIYTNVNLYKLEIKLMRRAKRVRRRREI